MKKTLSLALCLVSLALTPWTSVQAEQVSRLDRVKETHTLSVCTTGDYKPYSYLRPDGQYEGIDVAMAQSLAESLEAEVKWVPTTWKTLMPDFLAKDCDIAVGGISITLQRQQQAWYAKSLGTDGKIPLVRCEDQAHYETVAQMNRADVRLVEPAGGTNEAFVHRYLPEAQLNLFHDNVTIFQQLVDHKADVMITDASEALYQQKRFPGLCAVNPDQPLQYGEKAYLLPRDDMSWKQYVDQWLHLSQETGAYSRMAEQWIGAQP